MGGDEQRSLTSPDSGNPRPALSPGRHRVESVEDTPDTARPLWRGIGQWHSYAESVQDGEPEEDDGGDAEAMPPSTA